MAQEKEQGDPEDNILHFEHVFNARLVDNVNVANIPISPRDIDLADPSLGSGKVVRISLVADKIVVEDAEVTLGKPKPEPVVSTSFLEVRSLKDGCTSHPWTTPLVLFLAVAPACFILPTLLPARHLHLDAC